MTLVRKARPIPASKLVQPAGVQQVVYPGQHVVVPGIPPPTHTHVCVWGGGDVLDCACIMPTTYDNCTVVHSVVIAAAVFVNVFLIACRLMC
jgi:hypothetical protein